MIRNALGRLRCLIPLIAAPDTRPSRLGTVHGYLDLTLNVNSTRQSPHNPTLVTTLIMTCDTLSRYGSSYPQEILQHRFGSVANSFF